MSVCMYVRLQDYAKSLQAIFMKFVGLRITVMGKSIKFWD